MQRTAFNAPCIFYLQRLQDSGTFQMGAMSGVESFLESNKSTTPPASLPFYLDNPYSFLRGIDHAATYC